jgi:hypothetical protein
VVSRPKAWLLLALPALLALLATACASVPAGGKAVRVRSIAPGVADAAPEVRQQPRTASPGDSPAAVVRGFLAAAKSSPDQHAIARTYLVPAAAAGWNDAVATRIIAPGEQRVVSGGSSTQVLLTGRYQGHLDSDLAYVPEDRPLSVTFVLRQIRGEWRIADPPPGVLLPVADFSQVYKPLDLYFLDPASDTVVPDLRYFDVKQAVLPTAMANRLLAGPSAWLKPGVRTAFPAGTRLRSNVVRDGDAFVVDLSVDVLAAPGPQQAALAAQLVWTLAKQFSVSGVRMLADGRPLTALTRGGVVARDAFPSYDPQVLTSPVSGYYLSGGFLHTTSEAASTNPATPAGGGLLSAAVSTDLDRLAAVRRRAAGVDLITGPLWGPLASRLVARSLTRPSWEPGGDGVFVVADGRRVLRLGVDGGMVAVSAPGLAAAGPVSALALSRDGVRAAVVAGPPGHHRLLMAVVERSGPAIRLSGLRVVAPGISDVVDLAWADDGHLLVLGRVGGGAAAPYGVDVDGATVSDWPTAGLPAGRQGVAAAPGEPDLVEAAGRIWRRQGNHWESPVEGPVPLGNAPFYPG